MNDRVDELSALRMLVSHRGVVELLDQLAQGPRTVRELRSALGLRRPGVSRVLRVVAAYGLVTADGVGSWDDLLDISTPIRLTASGWRTVELLASFAVWEALYEHTDSNLDR
ncbi:winged helix-turn-helix domain-containing protein [Nocardia sp. CDC160]|uniref:winged helix-turn-helix domain-containing protein n=1 Tax=Nocardia sp. CDC160 TaxID=3112166 RepID=UPI002DBA8797|nr:winged helix-turn-helix domain-containing protein [Nocardia sp. CDC160]MEC3915050.1 winged helix-turn-helix domain-containing protein [Nocardia sp. CDC160]